MTFPIHPMIDRDDIPALIRAVGSNNDAAHRHATAALQGGPNAKYDAQERDRDLVNRDYAIMRLNELIETGLKSYGATYAEVDAFLGQTPRAEPTPQIPTMSAAELRHDALRACGLF